MLPFYFVNVFSEDDQYSGNPLAVFVTPPEMEAEEMQKIANELNFAEVSFICARDEGKDCYLARTFTPRGEVPFAGHPALGTAYVIKNFLDKSENAVSLSLPAGEVEVSGAEDGLMWMNMLSPSFGEKLTIEAISPVLGLSPTVFDRNKPIQIVSTGLPFVIVPLMHLDAVKQASVNLINYNRLIAEIPAKAFFIYSPQTYQRENHYNGRVFGHYYGVPEDTASGSANGSLAAYLLKYNGQPIVDARVEQGHEIGRPSLLQIQGRQVDGISRVRVGGHVKLIAKGEWMV
jgi:trans-2,3-dihydro-3-hydroxyanthranilate isomerase